MDDVRQLFRDHKDCVFRLALSFTGSSADAEDVTQTVFLKLIEKNPVLEKGRERAWLLQVTANECRTLYRRLRVRSTVSLDEALAVAAPEGGLTEADTAKIVDVVNQTASFTADQIKIIPVE